MAKRRRRRRGLQGIGAVDCHEAQKKLRAARARKDVAAAWDISNTMRAHGCAMSLDGMRGRRRRKSRRK